MARRARWLAYPVGLILATGLGSLVYAAPNPSPVPAQPTRQPSSVPDQDPGHQPKSDSQHHPNNDGHGKGDKDGQGKGDKDNGGPPVNELPEYPWAGGVPLVILMSAGGYAYVRRSLLIRRAP